MVVAGTAGYGKSSLVSSWLAQCEPSGAVAWLTIDASDQDVGRLPLAGVHVTAQLGLYEAHAQLTDAQPVRQRLDG